MDIIRTTEESEYYFICHCNCSGCKNSDSKTMAEFVGTNKKEAIREIKSSGFVIHREYKTKIKNIVIGYTKIPFIQN